MVPTALLPSLLTSTLGAPAAALGLIEGVSAGGMRRLHAPGAAGHPPVIFLLDRDRILIRIEPGSALASVARHAVVAFQADEIDLGSRTGWTVSVVGNATSCATPDDRKRVALLPLRWWARDGRDHIVPDHAGPGVRTQALAARRPARPRGPDRRLSVERADGPPRR